MHVKPAQSRKDTLFQIDNVEFSVAGLCEVAVVPYYNPSDSSWWASVSYALLRSPASRLMCLAAAVVLAEHNEEVIVDESELFGLGARIDPGRAFIGIDASRIFTNFA